MTSSRKNALRPPPWLKTTAFVVTMAATAVTYAVHPISSKLEFVGAYPKYPMVDYGTGAQAEAIRRGEYLTRLGDCIACHTIAKKSSTARVVSRLRRGKPISAPSRRLSISRPSLAVSASDCNA